MCLMFILPKMELRFLRAEPEVPNLEDEEGELDGDSVEGNASFFLGVEGAVGGGVASWG